MSNQTIINLEKKKKHLAVIFSVIVFLILFLLQIFFFTFKYLEYHTEISNKLEEDYKKITMMWLRFSDMIENQRIPAFFDENKKKKFKPSDFFIYDKSLNKIVLSNNSDLEFNLDLLNNQKNYWVYEIDLWDEEYYILRKPISADKDIFIYTEGDMNFSSIIFDLFKFFLLSLIFSWLIYYLILNFINRLFKPVEWNIEEMEDFVHNVGHELKTPLANMKSSLELGKLKWDFSETFLDSVSEIDKMNNLIDSLLTLSNLDWAKKELTTILPIIEEEIKKYSSNILEKNISLNVDKKFDLKINTSPEHFKILFSNLFSNAIKYNRENWKIDIILDEKTLVIKDTWIWIEWENFNRIFEKFFREEFARGENWFGIWLSLVKKITNLYNWEIEIKSEKWIWTEFIIKF